MKQQAGFTISELLFVVILAGILAAMAAPNMGEFVKNNTRTANVNTMVTALNFARTQAVTRNQRVSLCKTADFASCAAVANGEFGAGWIVFTDYTPAFAGGAVGVIDTGLGLANWPDETVLRVFEPDIAASTTLRARRGGIAGTAIGGITFRRDGRPEDLATPGTTLSAGTLFNHCDDRGAADARAIGISVSGHVSLSRDTDNNGVDELPALTPLVCP